MVRIFSTYLLFFLPLLLSAQLFPGGNINVIHGSEILKNPWAGGLDKPQFSASDINNDNLKDIIVFDSKANKWLVFLNEGSQGFKYVPHYEALYPEIIKMGLIRDYNCDGLGDIFAHTNQGIQVFKNTNENWNPSFVQVENLLEYQIGAGSNNIYKYNNDIIAAEDFDGDGDIDILSFDLLGTTIPYYRNLSVENGFGCDSLIFEENTVCWGNFKEGNLDNNIDLNFMCKGNEGNIIEIPQNASRHTGSTLVVLDDDEDNDKDLLLGDVAYNNLVYLKNGGTNLNANMVSVETNFPATNTPVNVPLFPAGFYLDVDNDNLKDLLVSPNATSLAVNKDCVWYYKNTGNAANRFQLQQKNFLVETMIDYGSNSFATFFDHNADGLLDMLVTNSFVYTELGATQGNVVYYENTGTATEPEFTFVTDNYAFINNFNLEFVRPTFGDLDGDGDNDMIIGENNGGLHLFINDAGAGNTVNLIFSEANYFDIDVGTNSHPQLVDLNEDGLLDLIVGRKSPIGNIAYYRNIGTDTNAVFHKDTVNEALGNISVENPGFLFGYSSPFITEKDALGNWYIYVGSDLGFVHKFQINTDSLENGSFEELEKDIFETRVGKRTTISVVDINNDGANDYFVGNVRGGISFYSEVLLDTTLVLSNNKVLKDDFSFNLYPNPAKNNIVLFFKGTENSSLKVEIFDLLGKTYFQEQTQKKLYNINTSAFANGIYFVKVSSNTSFKTQKIVIKK